MEDKLNKVFNIIEKLHGEKLREAEPSPSKGKLAIGEKKKEPPELERTMSKGRQATAGQTSAKPPKDKKERDEYNVPVTCDITFEPTNQNAPMEANSSGSGKKRDLSGKVMSGKDKKKKKNKEETKEDEKNKEKDADNEKHKEMDKEKNKEKETDKEKRREKDADKAEKRKDKDTEKRKDKDTEKEKHKDKDTEKRKDKDTEKEKHKDKDTEKRKDKETDREKHKEKDTDKEKHKDKDTERRKEKDTEKEKHKDKDTEKRKEKDIEKHKDKDTEKRKDKETDKEKHKEKETDKEKHRDREAEKEKRKEDEKHKEKGKQKNEDDSDEHHTPQKNQRIEECVKPTEAQKKFICKWLNDQLDNSCQTLLAQFDKEVKPYLPKSLHAHGRISFDAHMSKNRYHDVVCLEQSRVILKDGKAGDDYIHANYVRGSPLLNTFICTQGPISNTIPTFWRMILQEKVRHVFMLCSVMEEKRKKCEQYWPIEENQKATFGDFVVTNTAKKDDANVITTRLTIEDTKTGRIQTVIHHNYITWPDRFVPKCFSTLFKLLKQARTSSYDKAVVHCSAGIGRTGTFVVIEYLLQCLMEQQKISLVQAITNVRDQRMSAVQVDSQFVFCLAAIGVYMNNLNCLTPDVELKLKKWMVDYDDYISKKELKLISSDRERKNLGAAPPGIPSPLQPPPTPLALPGYILPIMLNSNPTATDAEAKMPPSPANEPKKDVELTGMPDVVKEQRTAEGADRLDPQLRQRMDPPGCKKGDFRNV